MPNENMTFKDAYGVLQGHAETLRNQTEPNIDDLLSIVEESVSAYRVCKERIDAVEKALEKALTDVNSDAALGASGAGADTERTDAPARTRASSPASSMGRPAQKPSSGFDDAEDDIPF